MILLNHHCHHYHHHCHCRQHCHHHFQQFPGISRHFKIFPDISCHVQSLSAIPSHISHFKPVRRQKKPVPHANKSPSVGPDFLFLFCVNCFPTLNWESNIIRISVKKKRLILKSYVDLLNYPYKLIWVQPPQKKFSDYFAVLLWSLNISTRVTTEL